MTNCRCPANCVPVSQQNKTKVKKTKKENKTKKMSLSSEMEEACEEGNLHFVMEIVSSHPESITFSNEVSNLFFVFFSSFLLPSIQSL